MRNVTITRQKSGVACLGTMKVYIEDPIAGDLPVKMRVRDEATGLPVTKPVMCRKLGTLKNGEQATFPIGFGAAKIVVIADKTSRNYCSEYYQIPAGEEDLTLTGKNRYAPLQGNPFRFDGVTDEIILENRKRGKKIGTLILCISLIVGFAIGFASAFIEDTSPKTFSDEGMTITLTGEFVEFDEEAYTVCYGSRDVAVLAIEEKFAILPGANALNLKQYAHAVMNASGVSSEVKTEQGLTYFEYDSTDAENGEIYHYYTFVYKGKDAFWIIQFGMDANQVEDYHEQVFEWAATVKFN